MGETTRDRAPRRLAIFDLDGTITRRDTFLPYLRGWSRRHPGRRRHWQELRAIVRFLFNGRDRGQLKSDLLRSCMRGATQAEVDHWTAEFVGDLDDASLYPGAVAAIERHRAAGDRLVLLSASVDLYVPQIGRRFGFDETICTGVAWRAGRLDGALTTPNRRADEKRRCVETLRGRFPGIVVAAYGNSGSDLAHLAIVDEPLLVNAPASARRAARRFGIRAADWRNKSPA